MISLSLTKDNEEKTLDLQTGLTNLVPSCAVLENDNVGFVLRGRDILDPYIFIQDLPVGPAHIHRLLPNGVTEFTWYSPRDSKSWFINHFGYSIVRLETSPVHDEHSTTVTTMYAIVEVYATKINADRAAHILKFLEKNLADVTRTCFSATSQISGSQGQSEITPEVFLQQVSKNTESFQELLPLFNGRKRSRLLPKSTRIKANGAVGLTDHSVAWTLSHLDMLTPATPSPVNVLLGGSYYSIDEVEADILQDDTDVYENKVIAGYFDDVLSRLSEAAKVYEDRRKQASAEMAPRDVPIGFKSIQDIRRQFVIKYYDRLLTEYFLLKRRILRHATFFQQNLSVRFPHHGMPQLTPGFLSQFHYHTAFKQIVAYYRLGSLTLTGERFLYGLRTLDKLYEFYCLFRIIEAVKASKWTLTRQDRVAFGGAIMPSPLEGIKPNNKYTFVHSSGLRMTLYYDLEISTSVQTEIGLVDTFHTRYGSNSNYAPDFVMKIERSKDVVYAVLDAKYVSPATALAGYGKNRYADEVTKLCMKYLHGIGYQQGGPSPIAALLVLHPASNLVDAPDRYRSFHREANSLFSANPSLPIIGAVGVTPQAEELNNSNNDILTGVLNQLIVVLG